MVSHFLETKTWRRRGEEEKREEEEEEEKKRREEERKAKKVWNYGFEHRFYMESKDLMVY